MSNTLADLSAGTKSLILTLKTPTDWNNTKPRNDLSTIRVWLSTTQGFTPSDSTLAFSGPFSSSITLTSLLDNTTYYVRYAFISVIDPTVYTYSKQYSQTTLTSATGPTGAATYRIYIATANNAATPTTPATTQNGATPPGWSTTPVTLTGTQAQFQSDGKSSAGDTATTWSTPYLSYFKVDTLEAITANTGNLTVTGTFKAGTAVISGTGITSGTAGGVLYSTGNFAFGNSTTNITYNGNVLSLNGNIVGASNIVNGAISIDKFATGLEPVTIVTSVPNTKSTSSIFNSTDGKLYRWNGTSYVASVLAADVTGQLSDSQLADIAAAKLTGQITSTQITDSAISTAKLAAGAITAAKIAANTITANEIAANAITAGQIAANTITASQIAANTITASQIAANTITAGQIAAATITGDQIAANSIAADKITGGTITSTDSNFSINVGNYSSSNLSGFGTGLASAGISITRNNSNFPIIDTSSLTQGYWYQIVTVGTTNWQTVGGIYGTPSVGRFFVATGNTGSGTGTVKRVLSSAINIYDQATWPDYPSLINAYPSLNILTEYSQALKILCLAGSNGFTTDVIAASIQGGTKHTLSLASGSATRAQQSTLYVNNTSTSYPAKAAEFLNGSSNIPTITVENRNGSSSPAITAYGTIWASGKIESIADIASTSTTSGSLVITGGVGISGALYAGSLYDNGNRVLTTASLSASLNLDEVYPESYGAVGNGTTNDYAALQAAINTGRPVYLATNKTYYFTTGLVLNNSYQRFGGPGILKPSGNINAVTIGGGSDGVEVDLTFIAPNLQGCALRIANGNRVNIKKLHGIDIGSNYTTSSVLYIQQANTVVIDWLYAYCGGKGITWYGSDSLRSDILRIDFAVIDCANDQYGLDWDGNCHSLEIAYLGLVTTKGVIIRNTSGGSTYPAIGRFNHIEIDYPSSHGIEILAGLDYDFNIPYILGAGFSVSSPGKSGIKIASNINSYQVRIRGGKSIGNTGYGIENAGGVVYFDGTTDLSNNTLGRTSGSIWTALERLTLGDDNYYLTMNSGNPLLALSSSSTLIFNRSTDQLNITVANNGVFQFAPTYSTSYKPLYITSTTASTGTTNGALVVSGGVGIAGKIWASDAINSYANITAYYSSDARLKQNIKTIKDPVKMIDQIRGVYFDWTDDYIEKNGGEDGYFIRKHDVGVIAQEVEAILPEIVATRTDGYKAVMYEKLIPLIIEAIKELDRRTR